MPKIAYVCDAFPPAIGGGELANSRLATELRKSGNSVTVLTRDVIGAPPEHSVLRLPDFRVGHVRMIRPVQLLTALRSQCPDVIISVGPSITCVLASIAAKILRVPFVYFHFGDINWRSLFGRVYKFLFKVVFAPLIEAVLVYAPCHVKTLVSHGVSERRIRVTTLGCDVPLAASPAKAGCSNIVFVGGLDKAHEYKRPDLALQALAMLPDKNVVLHLIGGGDASNLIAVAEKCGVVDRVVFHGALSESEKRKIVADSQVLVLPSPTSREGFGLVVVEAMRMGVPVVVGTEAGCAWIVESTGFGKTYPGVAPADLAVALTTVLSYSEAEREAGHRNFSAISQKFSWESMAHDVECLCKAVISHPENWFHSDCP